MPAVTLLASIPSPSSGTLEIGPLTIHMYGLMLLAGIAACISITGLRWVARGGDWDLIFRVAVWGVGRRHRRSAALPPRHELERGAGRVVGAVRRLGGRPRHLGRDRRRRPRRRPDRAPVGSERPGAPRRCGARPPRRPGDRPRRQLVEPGALRQADGRRRGGSRSTPLAARTSTSSTRPSTRRSSTRRSGISPPLRSCSCSTAASASGRPRSSRSTSPSTRASASTSRACASTLPRSGSACA